MPVISSGVERCRAAGDIIIACHHEESSRKAGERRGDPFNEHHELQRLLLPLRGIAMTGLVVLRTEAELSLRSNMLGWNTGINGCNGFERIFFGFRKLA